MVLCPPPPTSRVAVNGPFVRTYMQITATPHVCVYCPCGRRSPFGSGAADPVTVPALVLVCPASLASAPARSFWPCLLSCHSRWPLRPDARAGSSCLASPPQSRPSLLTRAVTLQKLENSPRPYF